MKIAFYKGTERLFNRAVVWKTSGPYSHVEALFEQGPADRVFLCASASFQDKGVRFKTIYLKPEHWDIIEVPNVDREKVRQWFLSHRGEPYDVQGLVNFLIPVGHNPDGWFCDEAVAAALGIPMPHRFDPTDLACILMHLGGVWQGGNIALLEGNALAA